MSAEATRWAWHQASIRSASKMVLLYLAASAPKGVREVTVASATIARWTNLNRKTVPEALSELREAGLISIETSPGGPSAYTLHITEPPV